MATGAYNLDLKPQKRNVFVTQLHEGEYEDAEEQDFRSYPVVRETAGKLLETGVNTLQRTLLLKKEVEVDKVDDELRAKREEFRKRMEECTIKQVEVQKRQQKMKDRVLKFEKFIQENETKRKRAIMKYHTEVKLKDQKTDEYAVLCMQLEDLKAKQARMDRKLQHHRKFYEFLLRVIDNLPENYIEMTDDMVTGLMMRHQTLSDNNEALVNNLVDMTDEIETLKTELDGMKQEHDKTKLSINSRLSHMQKQQEEKEEVNQHTEEKSVNKKAEYRDQLETLGVILMSIDNISEKCLRRENVNMTGWSLERKLEMIKDFLNEREDVYKWSSHGMSTSASTEKRSRSEKNNQAKKAVFR